MASHSCSLSPIHFFKIIPKSNLETIRIPNKFTEKYGGCLPNPVFLKPPNGKEWKVNWTKDHDNGFWFQKGWKDFSSFYSLEFGHLVLFKYDGTSQLDVHIFDQSASEIDYPLHDSSSVQKHSLNNKISDENVVEILDDDDMPPNQKVRPKTTVPSPRPFKKMRTVTHQDVENRSSNLQNLHVSQKSTNSELENCKHESEEDMEGEAFTENKCLTFESMKPLTAAQKNEALKRASTFRSGNVYFKVVMQPSYVSGKCRMTLPLEFARTHLHIKSNTGRGSVKLLVEDRVWSVGYTSIRSGKKLVIRRFSCKQFCKDNDLKVGDVCVFELMPRIKLTLQVTIFRASEQPVHSNDSGKKLVMRRKLPTFPKEREGRKSAQKSSLLFMPRNYRALEEAKRFRFISNNLFFTICINSGHLLNSKPYIPRGFMTSCVEKKKNVMIEMGNRSWLVKIRPCGDSTKFRFSSGWDSFARESKLQVGDICIFELIQKGNHQVLHLHVFGRPS